jgi:hypothetical protein
MTIIWETQTGRNWWEWVSEILLQL